MDKLLKDLYGDWSSGLLVKLLAFVFDVELGIACLAVRIPIDQAMTVVGELIVLMTAFQVTQSATAKKFGDGPVGAAAPVGALSNPYGSPDLGRWIKFLSFLVGVVVLNYSVFFARDALMDAVKMAGMFFSVATSTEIAQKATGT